MRWEEEHRFLVDATGTGFLLLAMVATSADITAATAMRTGATPLLAFAVVAPLAWRRVRPAASAAAVYTAALLQLAFWSPLVLPADLAVLLALYSVTVHGPRWAHRVAIVGALVGSVLLGLAMNDWYNLDGAFVIAVFTGVLSLSVWAFGLVRRSRRETISALRDRAEQLEVERDQQSQIATAAERARIAREMHDIVAHSLTVMIAQADGGRYAADADPGAATRALGTIAETGRAALTDMRRLLGVLRGGDGRESTPGAPLPGPGGLGGTDAQGFAPQPAESDIGALVDQMRSSGMRASLVRMGEPRNLPPGAGLTVFRIAQESLTNVLKHAGPDPLVTVLVQWLPDSIVLQVSDDGRGASADTGSDGLGQGLLGMRERATMFGGTVSAGPRPGGGFRVRAQLPTPSGTATTGPDVSPTNERTAPVPSPQDEVTR